jgi:phosphoglycerate dehydrogenase-like enzyme
MIIAALIILLGMNIVTWTSLTKVEKDLEEAQAEIEELKEILRNSEK